MNKKLFLTSAIAMGVIAPAFAETFPSDGYMKENKTYDNAATADNMDDVYEGTVNAVAEYDVIDYILTAGKYLPKDSETITTCPAGSYCAGGETFQYSATADQGIETCPTGYALSADGASSANDCYRTCTTSDVEHSTGVSGGYYYGNNNQCEPTGCVNGWHKKEGLDVETAIGQVGGTGSAYINNAGSFSENSASYGATHYGLTNNNTWAVDYGDKGMLIGQARCSTRAGASDTWTQGKYHSIADNFVSSLTDETGQDGAKYCYCNLTGYKDASGTLQSLSSSWVFIRDYGAGNCADDCASYCAFILKNGSPGNLVFNAALLGSVQPTPAMCEANTITINWDDVDPEYAGQNNEGTATYGEDVRTPVKANTYKGKTFKGWKFSKPTTTQLP